MHVGTTRKADKGRALAPSRTSQKKPAVARQTIRSRVGFESTRIWGYRLARLVIAPIIHQSPRGLECFSPNG